MRSSRYGVDAPGLVRAFLLASVFAGAAGVGLIKRSGFKAWAVFGSGFLFLISAYGLGMFCYMLWGSLVTKVKGREAILDLVSWSGDEQVLDVGCGRGLLLVGAAHRLTSGRAVGIDLWLARDQSGNEKPGALANAEAEGVADRIAADTGDMRQLPYPDDAFDVVLSCRWRGKMGTTALRPRIQSSHGYTTTSQGFGYSSTLAIRCCQFCDFAAARQDHRCNARLEKYCCPVRDKKSKWARRIPQRKHTICHTAPFPAIPGDRPSSCPLSAGVLRRKLNSIHRDRPCRKSNCG